MGGLDELIKAFEERLKQQKERHQGGSKWIGTGGTSPVGNSGHHPGGMRIGGVSRNKSAVKVAGERQKRVAGQTPARDTIAGEGCPFISRVLLCCIFGSLLSIEVLASLLMPALAPAPAPRQPDRKSVDDQIKKSNVELSKKGS